MNTGTLISDLMATVERAEMQSELRAEFQAGAGRSSEQHRVFDDRELQRIYGLQTEITQHDRLYMGAA